MYRKTTKYCICEDEAKTRKIILFCVAVLIPLVIFIDGRLPTPSSRVDEFSEERARKNLDKLVQVGVHVSGSEASDVITVNNILYMLNEIKNSVTSNYSLDIDVHKASGGFKIGVYYSIYMDVTNVVAKLEPKNLSLRTNNSILVNCHFDAFPGSSGASDDFVMCAAMLEVIEVIYKYGEAVLQNSIIFLFNGAEEIGFGGSHGFITGKDGKGHPWSKNVRGFVNLDAAGSGGKEVLFQTARGHEWMLKAYAKGVKHPFCLVLGEEAFDFDLIPGQTDFVIFNTFGKIPGLDMAFIKNDWVYHTKMDAVNEVSPGSIQHVGDNLLGIVEHLGNLIYDSAYAGNAETPMVFFDIFGLFMIYYPATVGVFINVVVAAIFIRITFSEIGGSSNWRHPAKIRKVSMLFTSSIRAWLAAVGAGAFSGAFLNLLGHYKPFHSYPFLGIILFGVPAVLAQILGYSIFCNGKQETSWLAGKFTFAVILIFTSFKLRSSYLLAIEVIFAIFAFGSRRLIAQQTKRKVYWAEVACNLIIGELIPFLYMSNLTITIMEIFVPMLGHTGVKTNSNVYLGVLASITTSIFTFNSLSSYFVSCKKSHLVSLLLASIFILNPLIAIGFIGKIPFQEKTPMRLKILDTDRTWYNPDMTENKTDAGCCFWPLEPNTLEYLSEISKTHPQVQDYKILEMFSCADLYCSLPIYRWPGNFDEIPWIERSYSPTHTLKNEVQMQIRKIQITHPAVLQVDLVFRGPPQNSIAIRPNPNWDLRKVSFATANETFTTITALDWPICVINLCKGYSAEDLHVTVVLKEISPSFFVNKSKSDLMEVLLVGHLMRDTNDSKFKDFVRKFPSWTNVNYWTSIVKQYRITTPT